jgi:hypothetical protein
MHPFSPSARGLMIACLTAAALTGSAITVGHAVDAPVSDQIGLPAKAMEDAAAYKRFVTEAEAVSAKFKDGNEVRKALKTGASYESRQLQSGEVAYAALVALQDKHFVAAVRAAADRMGPDAVAERLLNDPEAVMELEGAGGAAVHATAVLSDHGRHVYDTGAQVKQAAYTIQHQSWSLGTTSDRPQRLAQVKTLSGTRSVGTAAEMKRLMSVLGQGDAARPVEASYERPAASPIVTHGVALAALAVLGRAQDADSAKLDALMTDKYNSDCLHLAKLNLFQCLAVAGPRYEDVFCLGEHGLKETGTCLSKAATAPSAARYSPRPRDDSQQLGDRLPVDGANWPRR